MNKKERQEILKKVISDNTIENQADLIRYLEDANIHTTQSTISRDMRELNIIKSHGQDGISCYKILAIDSVELNDETQFTDEERLKKLVSEVGVSLTQIEFTNVLNVLPGNGQLIGVLIDNVRQTFKEIVGCIAGDDTILILSQSKDDATEVYEYFDQFMLN